MGTIPILLLGIAIGFVLTLLLRRNTAIRQQDRRTSDQGFPPLGEKSQPIQYIRPHAAAPASEPDSFHPAAVSQPGRATITVLTGTQNKINDIKTIRDCVHIDLKDAKDFVENLPGVLAKDVPDSEVARMQRILEAAGMQVRIG